MATETQGMTVPQPSLLAPTSGKGHSDDRNNSKELDELKKLSQLANAHLGASERNYDDALKAGLKKGGETGLAVQRDSMAGFYHWIAVKRTQADLLNPATPDVSVEGLREFVERDANGPVCQYVHEHFQYLNDEIVPKVKRLKDEMKNKDQVIVVQEQKPVLAPVKDDPTQADKNPLIPERRTDQWVYDLQLYYVRPDNAVVSVDGYITEFVSNIEFDTMVMPVYSALMVVPPLVARDLKDHFERIRWYMTVRKYPRNVAADSHTRKETVFEHLELTAMNPEGLDSQGLSQSSPLASVPSLSIKLDYVSKRNVDLNGKVRAKVFKDATVLDVITALLSECLSEQVKQDMSLKDLVRSHISPPHNMRTYEQIILDPGSVASNIAQLQEKYGVYETGIRVMFDSLSTEYDESTKKFGTISTITVTEKGGLAPNTKSLSQVLIEVVDKNAKMTNPEHESGSRINKESRLIMVRTQEGYQIGNRSAGKILDGDSVRVMGSSQEETINDNCDIVMDDNSPQRTYWSKNDNPYALTQLQDTIRERLLSVAIQVNNADVFLFNQNLKYVLKFYNSDDDAFSGEYRLRGMQWRFFSEGNMSRKEGIPLVCYMMFNNIPKISVNGATVARKTYRERVESMQQTYRDFKGKASSSGSGSGPLKAQPLLVRGAPTGGPYRPVYAGSQDYNGTKIPDELKPDYPLSKHVKFKDLYQTKDGDKPERGNAICQSLDHFCFAQKFSQQCLDPIFDKFGKNAGAGGKFNSFYRYEVPVGGSSGSMHKWAMAADMLLASGGGDALCEMFHWIATSGKVPFDQLILEGNGDSWRWIHVAMNYNGVNRGQILLIPASTTGKSNTMRMDRFAFTDKSMAEFSKFKANATK